MTTLKYCENYPNITQDLKRGNAAGKMAPIDWLDVGLPQVFNLQKKCGICEAQ